MVGGHCWVVGGELCLIRNYYLIRDLRSLTQTAVQKQPPFADTVHPQRAPNLPISSQSPLNDDTRQQQECTSNNNNIKSSGRRNNSNAKTVVRWGTIDVVSQLLLLLMRWWGWSWRCLVVRHWWTPCYNRILTNCCWALLTEQRWQLRWSFLSAVAFRIVYMCERFTYGGRSRIMGLENGAFNTLLHSCSRKAGVIEVENRRLGLITMIKT